MKGILGFPFAFKATGLGVGIFLMLFLGIVSGTSLHIIALATEKTKTKSYQQMVLNLLGNKWRLVCELFLFLYHGKFSPFLFNSQLEHVLYIY
jgi:amino acid permease